MFVFAAAFRLALLYYFPVPYGNDAAGRLYFRDTVLFWHWLPVAQVLVYGSFALTHSILFIRCVFAIVSSLAAVAFTHYLQGCSSRRTALIGGTLFATNPLLLFLSLMPYQEVVFLGLMFGSLVFLSPNRNSLEVDGRQIAGWLLYGFACLTRYEAWFVLPALLVAALWRAWAARKRAPVLPSLVITLVGLGWGPAMWMLINALHWGSPTAFLFHIGGHQIYAWDPHAEWVRISTYVVHMMYWLARFGGPLLLFAVPGVLEAWRRRKALLPYLWPVLLLLLLVLIFLVFVAAREFATANRFACIPLSIALVFVAIGLDSFWERRSASGRLWTRILGTPVARGVIAGVLLICLLLYGAVPVMQANRLPEFRDPYEIAQFLQRHLRDGERAVVVAEHHAELREAAPMPYQRIYGQLTLGKDELLCAAFVDPRSIPSIEKFVQEQKIRYLVICRGTWPPHGSDSLFLSIAVPPQGKLTTRLQSSLATVYEIE